MTTVEEIADAAWAAHLERCDACNYDRMCPVCDLGGEATEHGCNCRHGHDNNGWHIRSRTTAAVEARERAKASHARRIVIEEAATHVSTFISRWARWFEDRHERDFFLKSIIGKLEELRKENQ